MSCARVFCASVTNCTVADVKKGKDNYMQAAQQLMHVELKQKSMDSFKTDRVSSTNNAAIRVVPSTTFIVVHVHFHANLPMPRV